jgi:hypothetical protein
MSDFALCIIGVIFGAIVGAIGFVLYTNRHNA